jgi:transposase
MADIASQDPDRPVEETGAARPGPRAGQRKRRTFTATYKARMLAEYDRLDTPGARGALLRREGLYHSHIQNWRKAAQPGAQPAPAQPAGRGKAAAMTGETAETRKLKKENARLQAELTKSQAVAEAMGKLAALLEILSERADTDRS